MNVKEFSATSYLKIIYVILLICLYDALPSSVLISGFLLICLTLFKLRSNQIINLLLIPLGAMLYLNFGIKVNPESMISFFVLTTALKIAQTRCYRDFFISILCLFFSLAGLALFESSIFIMTFIIISILILLAMIGVKDYSNFSFIYLKRNIQESFLAILLASPIVIILFVFFPRINSFFPSINSANKGKIGYTPDIKNDQVSSLSSSSLVAFRARMKQINRKDLYWRGRVLDITDGFNWSRRHHYRSKPKNQIPRKKNLDYTINLAQNYKGDVFVLRDAQIIRSSTSISKTSRTLDNSFFHRITKNLVNYSAKSSLSELTYNYSTKNYLQLPKSLNSKKIFSITKPLNIKSLRKSIRNYMIESKFIYSLSPGLMKSTQDLLKNKKGFCSHYASLIAIILRQNSIPARIISGFQGGEYNEFGSYYIIRSNDAHAWLEAYLNGRWHRIDPTAYISPSRIELGGQAFINPFPMSFAIGFNKENLNSNPVFKFYNQIKFYIDNKNVEFVSFFENFNKDYQKKLARLLNMKLRTFYMVALWGTLLLFILIFLYFFFISKRTNLDPIQKLEVKLRENLKKKYPEYREEMTLKKILDLKLTVNERLLARELSMIKYQEADFKLKELKNLLK